MFGIMWDTVWNINRFNLKSKQMEAEDKYMVFYLDANFL